MWPLVGVRQNCQAKHWGLIIFKTCTPSKIRGSDMGILAYRSGSAYLFRAMVKFPRNIGFSGFGKGAFFVCVWVPSPLGGIVILAPLDRCTSRVSGRRPPLSKGLSDGAEILLKNGGRRPLYFRSKSHRASSYGPRWRSVYPHLWVGS